MAILACWQFVQLLKWAEIIRKLQETLRNLGVKYESFMFGRWRVEEKRYKILLNFKFQRDSVLWKQISCWTCTNAHLDKSTQPSCRHSKSKSHLIFPCWWIKNEIWGVYRKLNPWQMNLQHISLCSRPWHCVTTIFLATCWIPLCSCHCHVMGRRPKSTKGYDVWCVEESYHIPQKKSKQTSNPD